MMLLARLVVPFGFHETFLILWRKLRPVYLDRELGQLACEFERHLIVLVVHCSCIESTGSNTFVFLGYRNPYSSRVPGSGRVLALEFSRISGRQSFLEISTSSMSSTADRRRPAMIAASFKTSLGSVVERCVAEI
jgi:hypothetical protein